MRLSSLKDLQTILSWYKQDIIVNFDYNPEMSSTILILLINSNILIEKTISSKGLIWEIFTLLFKNRFKTTAQLEDELEEISELRIQISELMESLQTIDNHNTYSIVCRVYVFLCQLHEAMDRLVRHTFGLYTPVFMYNGAKNKIANTIEKIQKTISDYESVHKLDAFDPEAITQLYDPEYPLSFNHFPPLVAHLIKPSAAASLEDQTSDFSSVSTLSLDALSIDRSTSSSTSISSLPESSMPTSDDRASNSHLAPLDIDEALSETCSSIDNMSFYTAFDSPNHALLFSQQPICHASHSPQKIQGDRTKAFTPPSANDIIECIKQEIGELAQWRKEAFIFSRNTRYGKIPHTLAKIVEIIEAYEYYDAAEDCLALIQEFLAIRGSSFWRSSKTEFLYMRLFELTTYASRCPLYDRESLDPVYNER